MDSQESMGQMAHHQMFSHTFAGGGRIAGMAQVFPVFTSGLADSGSPLADSGFYLTQPAAMINVEDAERRWVLRVTPNLEALTQEDGELTFGGWGEGFLDARHPHTVLHEFMLSYNVWNTSRGSFSISGGKGFAPYGTDDPMSRPSVKYPTNHHLSQILERFTANLAWIHGPWSVEAGLFGGAEPDGPYDFSNARSFGDSWSTRVVRRFGPSTMGQAEWELGASFARVDEGAHGGHADEDGEGDHHGSEAPTGLFNVSLRLDQRSSSGLYGLVEYSRSDPAEATGFWSFLTEVAWQAGRHAPYLRVERATRPEFPREGPEAPGFFRYDHEDAPMGATRWTIASLGYGYTLTQGSASLRPFVEVQLYDVGSGDGIPSVSDVLGDTRFGAVSIGARLFLGGDPMRMGTYGVLDPMTRMR